MSVGLAAMKAVDFIEISNDDMVKYFSLFSEHPYRFRHIGRSVSLA